MSRDGAGQGGIVKTVLFWLRRYLLTGVAVIAPTIVTLWVFYKFFVAVDGVLGKYISLFGRPIPGLGFIAVISITILVGAFARNILGRTFLGLWEGLLSKIPLVNRVYMTVKQIGDGVFTDKAAVFKRVVLVEWPRKGLYALAFVTHSPGGELQEKIGTKIFTVFLPTTPNPTSGFFLVVPERETLPLSISVEDAIKLVISSGIVGPKSVARTQVPTPKAEKHGSNESAGPGGQAGEGGPGGPGVGSGAPGGGKERGGANRSGRSGRRGRRGGGGRGGRGGRAGSGV